MTRPTYGYGADDPRPEDPRDPTTGQDSSLPSFGGEQGGRRTPGTRPSFGLPAGSTGDTGADRDDAGAGSVPGEEDGRWGSGVASSADPYGDGGSGLGRGAEGSGQPRTGYGHVPDAADGYGQVPAHPGHEAPRSEEPPVCPRHPDRVSYVRCQRCHRPACPECQRPAAVGILCVDCARELEGARRQSAPRTLMGGITAEGRPIVTIALIAICAVLYLGQTVAPQVVEQLLIFAPFRALAMPWTFLTAGFLHGSILHILLNMYALWTVGPYLERSMGRARFLAVYLISILGGNVAVLLLTDPLSQAWLGGTLGASGGIFGLFGSLFVVNRRIGAQSTQVLVLIGLNLVITFMIPFISWQGHLGGLVLGTATTAALFALRPKATPGADRVALARRSASVHALIIAGAFVLCLVLIAIRVATLPAGVPLPLPF
ncbi:rhomboid family intramembrane serine protease [Brachybacterium sp. AOP25-B2-12]|uniref:rhomboid family intramembrane serine protease n=1 Tax=Brachybacterium sp. AOP25-B2-12 TaxID=3457710 RepID=UPI004033BBE1